MSLETFSDETVSDSLLLAIRYCRIRGGLRCYQESLEKVPPRTVLSVSVVFANSFLSFSKVLELCVCCTFRATAMSVLCWCMSLSTSSRMDRVCFDLLSSRSVMRNHGWHQ